MNYHKNFNFKEAEKLIKLALKEDAGSGDVTSELLILPKLNSKAELLSKDDGIIAGLGIFRLVFEIIDKTIQIKFFKKDGEVISKGEVIGLLKGNTGNLLKGERIALNILQRMSGIATLTFRLKKKLINSAIKIIDTRKTTPNFRIFEKLAVKTGGGENHRFGLYDMVLIKDNHIEANGGILNTLKVLRKKKKLNKIKYEIEVKNISELRTVIAEGKNIIDRVMLDNFRIADLKKAIELIGENFEIEISGGINERNISGYRNIKGIDYISVGSLTHSARALDIALNFLT